MKAITKYVKGSIQEFRQVTWPTQQQTIRLSIVCVIVMLGAAAFLALTDYLLGFIITT